MNEDNIEVLYGDEDNYQDILIKWINNINMGHS